MMEVQNKNKKIMQFYETEIKPFLQSQWIRAKARRCINRLQLFYLRHIIHLRIYHQIYNMPQSKTFKTMARDLIILPFMIGKKIMIHDGKSHILKIPSRAELGLHLGQMVSPKLLDHKHTSKTRVKAIKK